MGKSIDLTQPLSDEDRAWLEERGAYGDIRIADENQRIAEGSAETVAPESVPEQQEDDEDVDSESYGNYTKAQLQYELATRGLSQSGTRAELIDRLESDDIAAADDVDADADADAEAEADEQE